MALDDAILSLQRGLDRFVTRLRHPEAAPVTRRRLLIVQIDGLSREVLTRAMASGRMPFLRGLLRRQGYCLREMSVGLPTSTPAFQMAAMYGVQPDIPGFHYFDRHSQNDVHFPRPGHAARVEAAQATGRPGILQGGSAYGCVFTGGAERNLFTLASLTRPGGPGLFEALSPILVLLWVCARGLVRTIIELGRMLPRFAARGIDRRQGWRWITIKLFVGGWMRSFFTLATARDLYAGTPAVYVNYVDYDEAAHAFGPCSRAALITLRQVDGAIRALWRTVRRVPEHQYDCYILSDHGQTTCRSYRKLNGGQRFEEWIFAQLPRVAAHVPPAGPVTQPPDPEAHEQDGIRVISAGPNAFLYVLGEREPVPAEVLERRFPGLGERLSASPGVGFVLARSSAGPICFSRGKRHDLRVAGHQIFGDRGDAALVIEAIETLMKMPSAGDLVIYGTGAAGGNVSFLPEWGGHAGPSPDEMQTFIVHGPNVVLPSPIVHPTQLYEHFMSYQRSAVATAPV